jgi:hypothetical protein
LWGIPQTPLSEVRQAQALPHLCGYARRDNVPATDLWEGWQIHHRSVRTCRYVPRAH